MRKNRKDFKILAGNLLGGYGLLCLNENLHKEVKGNYYYDRNYQEVWNKILISLQIRYLLELAKVFDKWKGRRRSGSDKVISIHIFLTNADYKLKFKGFLRKINKIIKFRNEFIAHTNKKAARNPQKRLKELGLSRGDDRPIFERTISVLNEIRKDYKCENLELRFRESELRIQKKVEKFIEYSDRNASDRRTKK